MYGVLYVASNREAAVAETFGRIPIWTAETFIHASGRPFQIVTYEMPDDVAIFDLNDVDALKRIGIKRPAMVVTRDRTKTQAWARTIFEQRRYAGASWWSAYIADWTIIGLWDRTRVSVVNDRIALSPRNTIVEDAARAIVRQIDAR